MNEKIQAARDAATEILQPGSGDLEHGLELHANALVCEAYGFAPLSAVDRPLVRQALDAGASPLEVRDLIEDVRMTRHATDPAARAEFVEAWDAAGVTCILQNAGEEGQAPLRLIKRLARYTHVTDIMRDVVRRAATPDDIAAAKADGSRCLYLTGNGVPLPQDWVSVEEELRFIRIFFQLGCRMMHLTYNRRNMIGDGCGEPADGGLSDFGRAVVAEMNRVGVIVDVAHCGWRTSLDAARSSARPMVASHSVCAALNAHCRAKPDEVIQAIADTGGYIGICCVSRFLGGRGDVATFLDHIDYAVKRFGADHVAIGTDTAYVQRRPAADAEPMPEPPRRKAWESLWPPESHPSDPAWLQPPQRLSLAWTNWPLFTVGLVQRGYSDADIEKIVGGNVLRVARAVFDGRERRWE